jgi:hypothetical protein
MIIRSLAIEFAQQSCVLPYNAFLIVFIQKAEDHFTSTTQLSILQRFEWLVKADTAERPTGAGKSRRMESITD